MDETALFSEKFVNATFLFCYRRLGDAEAARDLAQEILLEALAALRRGAPQHFYSWYWKMAHNRYCLCLRREKGRAVSLDVCGGSLPAANPPLDDALVTAEERSRLYLAAARISAAQREIVILYYLRRKSIREISTLLRLPEGTVKRRLFDAKQSIRKGWDVMSNIGKAAFAPASLNLWGGFGAPKYWKELDDTLTRQIFVFCRNEAKTTTQIADETGVPPVYFEKKLSWLLENRLLKEAGKGRYRTDFLLFPEQAWADFNRGLTDVYAELGREVTDAVRGAEPKIRALDFYGNDFDFRYLLWIFYHDACAGLCGRMQAIYNEKWKGKIPENNGKDYRFAGAVRFPEEEIRYGERRQVGWSNLHQQFATAAYRWIDYENLFEHEPFPDRDGWVSDRSIGTLMKLFENPATPLAAVEQEQAAHFAANGLLERAESGFRPTLPVIEASVRRKIQDILSEAVTGLTLKYTAKAAETGERILLPHVRKDLLEEFVHWGMSGAFFPLPNVLYYGMEEAKTLALPEDYGHSAAALCLTYRK